MKISALKCSKCEDVIYSRALRDFRSCSCGALSVDGGFDYLKVSCDPKIPYSNIEIFVNADRNQLYKDWKNMTDEYGLILGGS